MKRLQFGPYAAASAIVALFAAPGAALAADTDTDAPIRLSMTIELAGADETDRASEDDLKKAGLPMIPTKPSARSRDPLATEPTKAADDMAKPAMAAPAAATEKTPTPTPTPTPVQESPAIATTHSDYYLRVDGGYAFVQDTDADGRNGAHRTSTLDGAALIGAGFGVHAAKDVRIEGSVGYRSAMDIGGIDGAGNAVDGEASSMDAMVNVYFDLPDADAYLGGTGFVPYIGAGIGIAAIKTDDLSTSGAAAEDGKLNLNLAYALMAGVATKLSNSIQLDLGYRFVNLGDFAQDGKFSDGTTAQETNYDDLLAHEVRAGLRFSF